MLLKNDVDKKYQQFCQNNLPITQVLPHSSALFTYTCALFFLHYSLRPNIMITIKSDIPSGSGFGSSAAIIVALLTALHHHYHVKHSSQDIKELALLAEQKQHGQSSGVDIHTSLFGGAWYYNRSNPSRLKMPDNLPLYWCNTGASKYSTGACISHAKQYLLHNKPLINEFVQISQTMRLALQNGDIDTISQCIRQNQALLFRIGIVPGQINKNLLDLIDRNISAKISGAGALTGKNAGCVIMISPSKHPDQFFDQVVNVINLCQRGCHVSS